MIEKKEIYSNYKRQNKWQGIIDYKTLTFIVIYCIVMLYVIIKLSLSFNLSIYLLCILISPILVVLFLNGKNESAIDILFIIFKYVCNMKVFVNMDYYEKNKGQKYINKESSIMCIK